LTKDQGDIKKRGCPKHSHGQPQTDIYINIIGLLHYCIIELLGYFLFASTIANAAILTTSSTSAPR
jgi:hypothetical protein